MKKVIYTAATAAVVAGLGLAGVSAASAATLYDNNNYTGASFTATTAANVGSLNDLASSVSLSGTRTFYEDAGYLGRTLTLSQSANSLGAYSNNLHFGETWSDRISSFK